MAKRYFNWKLAIVLVVAALVFAAAAVVLHRWQKNARAGQSLPQAQKAYEERRWDQAAELFGRYLGVDGQNREVLLKYAEAQINRRPITQGSVQQADGAYRRMLRLNADDIETARRLTELYLRRDVFAPTEAELIARRYLERQEDPALRRMLAQSLYYQSKFGPAAEELKKAIAADPTDVLAYELLAAAAEAAPGTAGEPQAWIDEAVSKNPDLAMAYAVRATYHARHNNKEQAAADLNHAMTCDLSDSSARLRVISGLIGQDLLDKAREQLQALQASHPTELGLWGAWADVAFKARSKEEMRRVAAEGMKALGLEAWDFMPVAAHLLIVSSDVTTNSSGGYELTDQAVIDDYLSRLRNREIEPPTVAYLEGLKAEKLGRLWDAVTHWQRAVSSSKNWTQAAEMAHRAMVGAFSRLGDNQSAVAQLQILLSRYPRDVVSRMRLAQLYAMMRDWPRVQETTSQIREIARDDPGMVSDAMLLALRAQAYILAASGAPQTREEAWVDLEARAAELDKARNGDLDVRLLRIQIAMMHGKLSEADSLLAGLEAGNSSDARLPLLRAELCVVQGKDAEARTAFENAISQSPQSLDAVRGFALFLDRQNRRQECESVLRDALTRIPESLARRDLSLLLAEFYLRWQQNEKYCQQLTELAAQYPSDIQPRRLLLSCESVKQDPKRSQQLIDEIKKLEGEKGSAWRFEQASLLVRSQDRDWQEALKEATAGNPIRLRALPAYAQITKLLQENLLANPEDQASRLLLAGVCETAGEQQLALTMYREAHDRAPGNVAVLVRLISALHKVGEYSAAQEYLDKAEKQHLLNPALQRLRVDNDLRHDDPNSAARTLQELIQQDPNDVMLQLSYARALMLDNELAQAEAVLTDLKAKHPEMIQVSRAQIRLCMQQGKPDKAIDICNDLVDKLNTAAVFMLRAEVYLALKENEKAIEDLGRAIAVEPQNPDSLVARARVYSSLNRLAEAISDVRRAQRLVESRPVAQKLAVQKLTVRLLIASRKESLWREAEALLDQALTDPQGKADPEFTLLKAELLKERATGPAVEEARVLLQQITSSHPKYVDAWTLAAQLELQQEELGRAVDITTRGLAHNDKNKDLLLLKAIAEKRLTPGLAAETTLPGLAREYPDDVGIVIEWADAYARDQHPEKAVKLLEQKLPSYSGAARRRCEIALAAALYSNGQEEKAKGMFDTLITADPNDPVPVMTLAGLLRKQRRWTEVNDLVNRWRTANPKDAETATNVARILAGSGDKQALQMAEDQLRMILDASPDAVPTLVLLSMLVQDAGRNDEASRLNRRILAVDPNNVVAINNLAWILCDQPSPSPEALKEAVELSNRGLGLMPDYMDLLDTRGVAHYRSGNLDMAVRDFTKCIELFPAGAPQSAATRFHLARALADMNRKTEALEHLRQAMALNRKNVQVARDHADAGRKTHAMKVLRDALKLEEDMAQLKTRFDPEGFVGIAGSDDWTQARLLLDQLQKGR
ncbi:MAG TPA: tetratricopeptide repeat protein [Sedimentisphaerales bacterium]|jgi:tetratricopeptide (TPR) repeat protein|nr:tetratricopeptide repeat protein [Sedimentisphaerales bacterium]HNU29416.1 tetratricopeptide repeat protein [Sedimentisphaerales bacterium]